MASYFGMLAKFLIIKEIKVINEFYWKNYQKPI